MRFSRRSLLAGAATFSGAFGLRFPAGAAEYSFRLATEFAANHPSVIHALSATAKIKRQSDGRVEILVFPNNSLGSGPQMLGQVRLGAIEFSMSGDNTIGAVARVAGICSVPFAFTSQQAAAKALDGALGGYVRNAIAGIGLHALDRCWPVGIRQTANGQRPINSPADLKGLKIRTPDDPVEVAFFKALGAIPTTSIPTAEIYLALQTRLADGADMPIVSMETLKIFEVVKYASYTNHGYVGITLVANNDVWQKFPANLRTMVERNFDDEAVSYREELNQLNDSVEATLRGQGMVFNHLANVGAFRDIVSRAGIYSKLRDDYGADAWAVLEKQTGKLT